MRRFATGYSRAWTGSSCGSKTLYNANAPGVKLRGLYGAFAEHVIYYVVEADEIAALQQFLMPGFKRCKCRITPVSEEVIVR